MTTLGRATLATRRILLGIAVLIIGLMLITALVRFAGALWERFFPTPPPAPTVAYGKIPFVPFPQHTVPSPDSVSLDTVSGTFPTLPTQIVLSPLIQPQPNLLSLRRASDIAQRIGFPGAPVMVSDRMYRWSNSPRQLTIDIITFNLELTTEYAQEPLVRTPGTIVVNRAIASAREFITTVGGFPEGTTATVSATRLYMLDDNGRLISADSLGSAQVIEVSYLFSPVHSISFAYPYPPSSLLTLRIAASATRDEVISASIRPISIDTQSIATYPIITPEQAFEQLRSGNAYIASHTKQNASTTKIREVSLEYYISDSSQKYLWPVYVFRGDNEFMAYVPALPEEWVNMSTATTSGR